MANSLVKNDCTGEACGCQLCGSVEKLTKHHLIPQVRCNNRFKGMKDKESNWLWVCETCHRTIHAYFSETFLRDFLFTKENLVGNEKFSKYLKWRRNHTGNSISPSKKSNKTN